MQIVNENDGLVVKYIDKMGTDLSVVNAARVSFAKTKDVFDEADEKLIKYLATHNHWTPFGHASLQVHVKAPIAIAAQLKKHQVGLVWNEISRRYVDSPPEIFMPSEWRAKATNKKQGSMINVFISGVSESVYLSYQMAFDEYERLLQSGVAPEQARFVLPQAAITEWYWSGSLAAFARIVNLRDKPDSQLETQIIARQIHKIMLEYFPISTKNLMEG